MHPQLAAMAPEFRGAPERLRAPGTDVPADRWSDRPAPGRGSVAECIAHLNLTCHAFLPRLEEGLARARRLGNLLSCFSMPPPHQHRHLWRAEQAAASGRLAGFLAAPPGQGDHRG